MAIIYYLQSKKSPSPIYIRIRQGSIDAKAKTEYFVDPENWGAGEVKMVKTPKGAIAEVKKDISERNGYLIKLDDNLNIIRSKVTNAFNNRENDSEVNSEWLKNIINPPEEKNIVPTTLIAYFDYYIDFKKSGNAPSTIKKLNVIKAMLTRFESHTGKRHKVEEVDTKFQISFEKFCDENNYAHNTKAKAVKIIKTVCRHANSNGVKTNHKLDNIKTSYKRVENIHLTFEEIDKIINTSFTDERLEIARDWLIISCFTAQRVSDFMRFRKEDIVEMEGMKFIDIRQNKTDDPLYLPMVNPEIENILAKRDGNFPPLFSDKLSSNETIYNELVKEVCRKSKINNIVIGTKKDPKTKRNETKEFKKYELVSSHIGRRSFASNYYGKINTALLIAATGHSTEQQFLTYVGKKGTHNSLQLAKELKTLAIQKREPKLTVIKNASNE
jgi:integrase